MKIDFIEVRYKGKITIPEKLIKELPERIILFTTIQYHNQLPEWQKVLENLGKKVTTVKPKHSIAPGHLLGCGTEEWEEAKDADAFLYVGDGLFHPKALVVHNNLPVWCYDPKREEYFAMKDEDIERAKKRQLGAIKKFYSSEKIGVLLTIKSGQQRVQMSQKLKEKFPEKKFYFVIFETLNFNALEDYPFVQCWINTMCPRIGLDDTNKMQQPVLNIGELDFEW